MLYVSIYTAILNYVMKPTPFIIWFNQRSGSTHLVSLLDSHPEIACFAEIFYQGEGLATNDLFSDSAVHEEGIFLEHFFSYRWGPEGSNIVKKPQKQKSPGAVGFKLKYEQAERYPKVFQYLSKHYDRIKVIHLVRENFLSTIASSMFVPKLLNSFKRPNLHHGVSLEGISRTVKLNPDTILKELETLEAGITRSRNAVLEFDTLEVTYENLVQSQNGTCRRILQFLRVGDTQKLSSRFKKIMPSSLEDYVENIDEIRSLLSGSKFSHLIE